MIKLRVFHEIHYFTLMVKVKDVKNRNYKNVLSGYILPLIDYS